MSKRWLDDLTEKAAFQARFTPLGRGLLGTAEVMAQPLDWYERRRAALEYNARVPSSRMTTADGYAILPSGSLPGTADVVDACRRLFEAKQAIGATAPPAGKKGGKGSFLRNLLSDDDLRANPILMDFALSDALFSVVTSYLGRIPNLNRVDLLYSIARPNADKYISSQVFHQDHEGLKQAKLFLNVFDVGAEHGPFTFIPADRSERVLSAIRRQRARSGTPMDGHYPDDEIAAHGALGTPLELMGPAGSAVVIDTSRCLHAGSRVRVGCFRLVLYVQYCTTEEKANAFDAARFRDDPVRWLAVKRHARST